MRNKLACICVLLVLLLDIVCDTLDDYFGLEP